MNLLLDQNISFRVAKKLKEVFTVCIHVSECELMDSEDTDIWAYAEKNGFTIVTFDADFYDISLINGHPPKVIWLRTGNLTRKEVIRLLEGNKDRIEEFITSKEYNEISCMEIL